jgi:hypothetical protein
VASAGGRGDPFNDSRDNDEIPFPGVRAQRGGEWCIPHDSEDEVACGEGGEDDDEEAEGRALLLLEHEEGCPRTGI